MAAHHQCFRWPNESVDVLVDRLKVAPTETIQRKFDFRFC